ncbi:MAG: hypothetical protein Q8J59_05440 [Methylotenera sp.]|nr:hypothetical protein [Methylotenera sp.]MDP2102153.1 hypothetical protein [Methylotenera sp.]MDP2281113.1 hypothetical protein [Methylotenera sp.]MDP2404001.1 hypothetical protein [Methylotenera sp.]MDP3061208.1 hypothetical protein [Methylotenera sp.]
MKHDGYSNTAIKIHNKAQRMIAAGATATATANGCAVSRGAGPQA